MITKLTQVPLLVVLSLFPSWTVIADNGDSAYAAFVNNSTPETAYAYLFEVATHPRCANCHGIVDNGGHFPTVGDDRRKHFMNITASNNTLLRVVDDRFEEVPAQGLTCRNCHRDTNGTAPGMPPGAANDEMPGFVWHMPPATMAIPLDMTPAEHCSRWVDPAFNSSHLAQRGGRDDLKTFRAEFLDHHASIDPLVRWSWTPGPGRTPAPGSHREFVDAMEIWISGGAPCPE